LEGVGRRGKLIVVKAILVGRKEGPLKKVFGGLLLSEQEG